jgi:peptidoglycan/xylan/chitin deacetylase (PgdA/CDA1 family)
VHPRTLAPKERIVSHALVTQTADMGRAIVLRADDLLERRPAGYVTSMSTTSHWAVGLLLLLPLSHCSSPPKDASPPAAARVVKAQQGVSTDPILGTTLGQKTLALTFDDGPGDRTVELSGYLAAHGIRAVFFVNGKNVPGRQNVLDAVTKDGHLLGNHTQNHLSLPELDTDTIVSEVTETDAIIAPFVGAGPYLFRPPFLAYDDYVAQALGGSDMSKYVAPVDADIGTQLTDTYAADWACWDGQLTLDDCATRYLNEIHDVGQGIVLMHDPYGYDDANNTVELVKVLVPRLQAEGYTFARADEIPAIKAQLGN